MTKQNEFEKFWEKWNGELIEEWVHRNDWIDMQKEFAELCEKQAKIEEENEKKNFSNHRKAIKVKESWDAETFLRFANMNRGSKNAFRLVKPKLVKSTNNTNLANLPKETKI